MQLHCSDFFRPLNISVETMDNKIKRTRRSKTTRKANRRKNKAAELEAETSTAAELEAAVSQLASQLVKFRLDLAEDDRKNGFLVFVDIENLQDDLPPDFVLKAFRPIVRKALKNRYGMSCDVIHMTTIGNMASYKSRDPYGMDVTDVYPRDAFCDGYKCGKQIRYAVPSLRCAVNHERSFDIADDLLQEAMFDYVENYGTPLNFLVITGDGDFATPMRMLKERQVKICLAKPKNWNLKLEEAASNNCSFDFSEIMKFYRGAKSPSVQATSSR